MENPPETALSLEDLRKLPKIDLHRHLEGCLRVRTIIEIAREYGITVPATAYLRPLVEIQNDEDRSFRTFLSKFQTLRLFYRTPEIIERITHEAIVDAASDGMAYMELIFTPAALGRCQGFALKDVMDWVVASANKAAIETGLPVRLIVSVNRHEPVTLAEEVVQLAIERKSRGVCGLDLAGNEAEFPADAFVSLFKFAQKHGLRTQIHAGEWGGAENVRFAIENFDADRIGHGIRVMEDPNVVALAREHQTLFTVCLTSNLQSGAVLDLPNHPVKNMLRAGLNVTLNTDDPSISQITLSSEYLLAMRELGLTLGMLRKMNRAAAAAAFLPAEQCRALMIKVQ